MIPGLAALDIVEGYGDREQLGLQIILSAVSTALCLEVLAVAQILEVLTVLGTLAVTILLPAALAVRRDKTGQWRLAPIQFGLRDFGVIYLMFVAAALLVLGVATFLAAEKDGDKAKKGERIGASGIAGVSYLGLKAEPAFLSWRSDAPARFRLPRCVLYLGRAGGSATVYDYRQRRTMQLPESAVIVTVRQDRTSCAAPINERRPVVRRLRAIEGIICEHGDWSHYPQPRYFYTWIRDGFNLPQTSNDQRTLRARDVHHSFRCAVEAKTSLGSDVAYSRYFIPSRGLRTSEAPAAARLPHRRGAD